MANTIEVSRGDNGYYILWKPWNTSNAYTREDCIKVLKKRRNGKEVKPISGYRNDRDLVSLCNEVMSQNLELKTIVVQSEMNPEIGFAAIITSEMEKAEELIRAGFEAWVGNNEYRKKYFPNRDEAWFDCVGYQEPSEELLEDAGITGVTFEECFDEEGELLPKFKEDGRYDAVLGFNTKQWWVYDNENDVYIDPPASVLSDIKKLPEDSQAAELERLCSLNPIWLFEKEFWYQDVEI